MTSSIHLRNILVISSGGPFGEKNSFDRVPNEGGRATAASVTLATFGRQVSSVDDEYVRLIEKVNAFTSDAGPPGTTLVDLLPLRKCTHQVTLLTSSRTYMYDCLFAVRYLPVWLPGAYFKGWAMNARTFVEKARNMPYGLVKADRVYIWLYRKGYD